MTRVAPVLAAAVIAVLLGGAPAHAEERYSARVQSVVPSERLLLVEEPVGDASPPLRQVDITGAEVVGIRRDPERPARWVERPTEVYRLPVATYVIVRGTRLRSGVFKASRIEVPRPSAERRRVPADRVPRR
jgi:hypothetical protein